MEEKKNYKTWTRDPQKTWAINKVTLIYIDPKSKD